MRAVRFDSDDPAFHLACDEVILRRAEAGRIGECLRLYETVRPTLVLGLACRWERDADVDACRRSGVPILRRPSGGGAVLLGQGCLNYSLVLDSGVHDVLKGVRSSYRWILGRLVAALAVRGLQCRPAGLSDLAWNGHKVGGSAQKRGRRVILHHGTLLYDFRVDLMERFLPPPESCPDYRAGRRHAEFVANLPLGGEEAARAVGEAFCADATAPPLDMTADLADEVEALARGKYLSDAWNQRL
jgi:lipoate-protein ligase A